MGKVIVVGSSNTDMVVTTLKLPDPGETIMANEFNVHPGGKGANQAVASARADAEVIFVAKVGNDDFGKQAIKGYMSDKICVDHIFTDEDHASGIAMILVDENSGENSIVVVGGANNALSAEDIKQIKGVISQADILLMQLEIPIDVVETTLKMASESGVRTILNPAPARSLSDEILGLVDIITPNETEAKILTGIELLKDEDVERAATRLLEKVNEAVIITLGSRGVYLLSRSGEKGFIATSRVVAVDTTAAGDVFNGYLAAALGSGMDYQKAIFIANKAATLSVTRKGAQPSIPKISEILD